MPCSTRSAGPSSSRAAAIARSASASSSAMRSAAFAGPVPSSALNASSARLAWSRHSRWRSSSRASRARTSAAATAVPDRSSGPRSAISPATNGASAIAKRLAGVARGARPAGPGRDAGAPSAGVPGAGAPAMADPGGRHPWPDEQRPGRRRRRPPIGRWPRSPGRRHPPDHCRSPRRRRARPARGQRDPVVVVRDPLAGHQSIDTGRGPSTARLAPAAAGTGRNAGVRGAAPRSPSHVALR